MTLVFAVLLGMLGAALHDGYELAVVLRARSNNLPDEWKRPPFLVATAVRLGAGGAMSLVVYAVEHNGPISATLIGMLGPLLAQRIASWSDIGAGRD